MAQPIPVDVPLYGGMDLTRILMVEDDAEYSLIIERTLQHSDAAAFCVDWVPTLDSAFGCLKEREYDAMLLDLSLPDATGLSTVGSACSLAGSMPVLVLTGSEEEELAQTSFRAGAEEHLVKQKIDRRLLPLTIMRAIERHKGRSATFPMTRATTLFHERIDVAVSQGGLVAVLVVRYDHFDMLRYLFGGLGCDAMYRCVKILNDCGPLQNSAWTLIDSGTFAVVLENIRSMDELGHTAARLMEALTKSELRDASGAKVRGITASVGVALHPWGGASAAELLSNAKRAQVAAARSGGSRFCIFRELMS
jgi:DNA-binding response OmpR family regulator